MAAQAPAVAKPPAEEKAGEKLVAPLPPAGEVPAEFEDARWNPVLGLSCELSVDLAMPDFKINDLLRLRPGSVINAQWRVGQDVPLRVNGTAIGWIEFEVVAEKLAVRLTELA